MTPPKRKPNHIDLADMQAHERKAKRARGPATVAERVHKHTAAHSVVEWRECADPKRRKRLEANPPAWLRYYGREAFTRRFDRPHLEIIEGCMYAHETGGRLVVGAERGVGKSAVFAWMGLFFILTGRRMFPVVLPWDAPMMAEAFEIDLCRNSLETAHQRPR